MGDVIGDLNSRRGQIRVWKTSVVAKRLIALFRFQKCSVTLQTFVPRTQGRGNYSMFFEKYEQVPKNITGKDH